MYFGVCVCGGGAVVVVVDDVFPYKLTQVCFFSYRSRMAFTV